MKEGQPSRTALGAAMHRAAHQRLEGGRLFADPFALPIIGADAAGRLEEWAAPLHRRIMRLFIAARHRVADDRLRAALAEGIAQIVVVGAGLDTTALRLDADSGATIYEVDHPSTQAWKRHRLAEAGLAVPHRLRFAPVDFERQSLDDGLAAAGFDAGAPAFFIWLGVVPYLTDAAIFATLRFIAAVPAAQVVFDYANPPEQLPAEWQEGHQRRAAHVAALGEPWISYFDTPALHARLRDLGAAEIDDLRASDIRQKVTGVAAAPSPTGGGHIIWVRWP